MRSHFLFTIFVPTLVVTATAYLPDARACTAPACTPASAAPATSTVIPASSPALAFEPTRSFITKPTDPALQLRTSTGTVIELTSAPDPTRIDALLLTPKTPLVSGTDYVLRWSEACSGGVFGSTATTLESSFKVSAAAALPTALGTATVVDKKIGSTVVSTSSGSCTTNIEAVSLFVAVIPSPESKAFLPLTSWLVRVDGKDWANVGYGKARPTESSAHAIARLHAACGERKTFDDNGLALGKHKVDIVAHVAGAAADPPAVSMDVDLWCALPDAGPDGDAGADAPDAPDVRDAPDAPDPKDAFDEVRSDTAAPAVVTPGAEGCSCRAGRSAPSAGWQSALSLLILVGVLARKSARGRGGATLSRQCSRFVVSP